jgi:hypothetical protein
MPIAVRGAAARARRRMDTTALYGLGLAGGVLALMSAMSLAGVGDARATAGLALSGIAFLLLAIAGPTGSGGAHATGPRSRPAPEED